MMSFDPDRPLAPDIRIVENAVIVPFGKGRSRGISRPAGVYDAEGRHVEQSTCLRTSTLPTTVPIEGPIPEPEGDVLPGTWLFGGLLYQHFGHFLVESTGRLWARDHLDERPEGELFLLKKRLARPNRFIRPLRPLLRLFGCGSRSSRGVVAPLRVERLVVPPQGFGTSDMVAGCPEFRAAFRNRLAPRVEPAGAPRIYISRSRLYSKRGRYLGEERIERLLDAEGYRIFHPQDHAIEEQIAQYKAASTILSSDASALHLAAFFTADDDRVAIILRRPGNTVDDFMLQFRQFSGHEPDVIDALSGRYFKFDGAKVAQNSEVYAALDFERLGHELAGRGLIADAGAWTAQPEDEIETERKALSAQLGQDILPAELA